MNGLGQGLALSGIGILITFAALGILILLIMLLKAFFPGKDAGKISEFVVKAQSAGDPADRDEKRKRAAAAAVTALLEQEAAQSSGLGRLLESPLGNWWKQGLDRIHSKE